MKLLDTSVWVEFLRQRGDPAVKQAVARLLLTDAAADTCPVRFDLLSGVKAGEEADLAQALAFSQHLPVDRAPWRHSSTGPIPQC